MLVDWPVESQHPTACVFVYSEASPPYSLVPRLADGELNRIGIRIHQDVDRTPDVLDSREKRELVKEAVIDGHIETAARSRMEEAVKPG